MTVTFTTTLPDADQPVLSNGVEDEVGVDRETQPTNNGDVRWQIRETGQSSWGNLTVGFDEGTVNYDTLTFSIQGREDGEEYEVRLRTETAHETGAWTTPVSIVTKFPGAINPSITSTGTTSVGLSWSDQSDNEDGFRVQRRKQLNGQYGPWRTVASVAANTTTYTDGSVQPARTYQYRIEAFTDDTTATTGTVATTTTSTGARQFRVPAEGWYVEVDHPSGETLVPQLRSDPQIDQQVNGLPRLQIPVVRDERWQDPDFEDAPLRAWRDGEPQPVEQVVNVRVTEAGTTLEAEGGAALKDRVQTNVRFADAHTVVDNLVSNNTPYTVNVDSPASSTSRVLSQTASTDAEWDSITSFGATTPATVNSGGLEPQQVSFTVEAGGTRTTAQEQAAVGRDSASDDLSISLADTGDYIEFAFTLEYDQPAGQLVASPRVYTGRAEDTNDLDGQPAFDVRVDGTTVGSKGAGWPSFAGWQWLSFRDDIGTLSAGSHTMRIELTSDAQSFDSHLEVDVLNFRDDRYSYSLPSSVNSDGWLDGPEDYPDTVQAPLDEANAINQVVGGEATVSVDAPPNDTIDLALSNDGGSTYPISGSDTTSVSGTFASAGPSIRARLTLGRHGSGGSSTPATGFEPDRVETVDVYSDQESTPSLIDRTFDDRLVNVLQTIASDKDFVWELRATGDGPQYSFEMAQPGQRTSDANPDVATYDVAKNTGNIIERAVIKGGRQRRRGESFTATHGTAVTLSQPNIIIGTEAVYEPASGTQFERGVDYELNGLSGAITTLAGGSMSDGDTYEIDYHYKPEASYATGASDPKTVVRTLPAITSSQTAEQVAFILVSKYADAIYSATVTIPDSAGWSVIDEIDPSQVPTAGERLQTRNIETTPEATVIELATQDGLGETLQRIQQRLSATEGQV